MCTAVATGFITPTSMPRFLNAIARLAVTIVLPTPVSVPVIKSELYFACLDIEDFKGGENLSVFFETMLVFFAEGIEQCPR